MFNKKYKYKGLSEASAASMMLKDGPNELPTQKNKGSIDIFIQVVSEPMFLLLIVAVMVYSLIGEMNDAMILSSFVMVIIGITYYQERKTEKTLQALRNLSSPRAWVIREGEQRKVAGSEVVRGDYVIVMEGDRVPADGSVVECENLFIDESLLTGESVPVRKRAMLPEDKEVRPGGDDLPFVFSGSMVVGGWGIMKVTHTGPHTEIGKIGKSLQSMKQENTPLHKETSKMVKIAAFSGLSLCVLVVFYYLLVRNDLIGGMLAGITLSMSMIPEEFPVVLLIFMTLGAWRISKHNVLARKSSAIEALGAATVLCTDKTGTITMNKMSLDEVYTMRRSYLLDGHKSDRSAEEILRYAVLASKEDPFDPLEKEILSSFSSYVGSNTHPETEYLKEYPLSSSQLSMSRAWKVEGGILLASKGAPEAIADICHIPKKDKDELMGVVREMSDRGLRVIGVAKGFITSGELPENQDGLGLSFVGLLGFTDPIRPGINKSVEEVYRAGMRVIMITGDYPGTAQAIARKIGIINPDKYLTGDDLRAINHLDLRERIKEVNIFARVVPEQKLLIVNALKANNEVVAMTGDGVNDAPALKAAHIGVAMGERGTDVAREASSLVLLNDDFSSIVVAVRLGRRIYDNLKRAMGYIIAVHIPIAGMTILPLFFGLPAVLFPAHIAFLELIIDPACSVVFESEKESKDIMNRPPRNIRHSMFNRRMVIASLLQGLGVMLTTFFVFSLAMEMGRGEAEARSFAFACLVLANLSLIVTNLSWNKSMLEVIRSGNKTLNAILIITSTCLLMVLYIPVLSDSFHLYPLHIDDLSLVFFVSLLSLSWFEAIKYLMKKEKTKLHPRG